MWTWNGESTAATSFMLVHFSSLAKRIPEGFYPIIKLKEEEEEKRLLNLVEI